MAAWPWYSRGTMSTYKTLTYLGAAPFLFLTVFMLLNPLAEQIFAFLILIYGGFITSFLAGSHWKEAIKKKDKSLQFICMIPTIVSVFIVISAVVFNPIWLLPMLMALFVWLYRLDTGLSKDIHKDYIIVRRNITVLICTLLIIAFAISYDF